MLPGVIRFQCRCFRRNRRKARDLHSENQGKLAVAHTLDGSFLGLCVYGGAERRGFAEVNVPQSLN